MVNCMELGQSTWKTVGNTGTCSRSSSRLGEPGRWQCRSWDGDPRPRQKGWQQVERRAAMDRTGHMLQSREPDLHWPCGSSLAHLLKGRARVAMALTAPQGLRSSLPRNNQQRATASLGHRCRACARHLQQPISTGIKNPPALPSLMPLSWAPWAGNGNREAVIENLRVAPSSLSSISPAQPKAAGAKSSWPRRRC